MKMLLMFVVAAVLSGLSEGSVITKCELKSQLDAAALAQAIPTVEDFIVKLVSHVESSTGFNTSAVWTPTKVRRGAEDHQHAQQVLYGLFQLGDQVICSGGVTESHDICKTTCPKFIDDDITDDIACLKTTLAIFQTDHFEEYGDDLSEMFHFLEKESVSASGYFSECQ